MRYQSTRGGASKLSASEAILKGIADDGGLYVPETFPEALDLNVCLLDYKQKAAEIFKLYLGDYTEEEIKECVEAAYGSESFDTPVVAPLEQRNGCWFLELFHGKTLAFKDVALSILPHFMRFAAKKNKLDQTLAILVATSGDTGKAALEGFADCPGTAIVVFFPENGVSSVQKLQMQTQEGDNTHVVGVLGNFDDTQAGVKKIFLDPPEGFRFSSANSINIGRLLPQIVYYFHAYGQLAQKGAIALGDEISFTVPTGNFGNILAGYYAKRMGLPIKTLLCASNENKVLYDFFTTGEYDKNRKFVLTASPSMDILVSSNLERLLYHASGAEETSARMKSLSQSGRYFAPENYPGFAAKHATEEECAQGMKEMFEAGYVIDPHTAVAYECFKKHREETGATEPNVIISTASPFKFTESVCRAIDPSLPEIPALEGALVLAGLAKSSVPRQIEELGWKPKRHGAVCSKEGMRQEIESFLVGLR
ncbi:MAG: threonine synthase [Clostridiales bacterium]|jgi:threonine synthase|nr:threonine synthase [Clostridiales bacterium]